MTERNPEVIDAFEEAAKYKNIEREVNLIKKITHTEVKVLTELSKNKSSYHEILRKKYKEYLLETPRPLTKQESEVIDTEIEIMKNRKIVVLDKLDLAESLIEKNMNKRNQNYTLPIIKNRKMKRAARRFFGKRKSEITFNDFKKALKRKKELEKSEGLSLLEKIED